jgi:hypothetical protein
MEWRDMSDKEARAGSKRGTAIEVMKKFPAYDEAGQPIPGNEMPVVVGKMAEEMGVTEGVARSYYKWCVDEKRAPGILVETPRAPRQPKAPKAPKAEAQPLAAARGDAPASDEAARIKEKNLQRLKDTARKMKDKESKGAGPAPEDESAGAD